jgi:hypothetical protein
MKPNLIILLLAMITLQACNKTQDIQPIKPTLIGVWSTANATWVINNTDGFGGNVRYTAYQSGGVTYLHQVIPPAGIDVVYVVARLDERELVLVDPDGVELGFVRVR